MKTFLLMTTAALTLSLMSFSLAPETPATNAPVPGDAKSYDGHIKCWSVEEDGSVVLNLQSDNGEFHWFRTPANQSSTTQFELLVLHAVLSLNENNKPTTLRGESTSERDGSDRSNALRLIAIGCQ